MNKKIYKKIKENNKYLYHITEYENLQSILKNGLKSLKYINSNNVKTKFITSEISRRKDAEKDIDKYVRLAYTVQYDMICAEIASRNLKNPSVICINPNILLKEENIRYTTMNALKREAVIYKKEDSFDIDFDKIYQKRGYSNCSEESYKNARQSEVMVENEIEIEYFEYICIENNSEIDEFDEYGEWIKIARGEVKDSIIRMER